MRIPNRAYDDKELLEFIGKQESQDINWGSDYSLELAESIKNGDKPVGAKLPWNKSHDLIRFREGNLSLWAGINGHMKSMLTGQVMMWIARQQRVGIASFEMPVVATMRRLVKQAAGCSPSENFAKQWAQWNEDRICYYDQLNSVAPERVLGVIFHMAKEMGCKHVMIDSLTKCGLPTGDREAEKHFIDTLSATAKALKIHIHIVAHVRKPPSGDQTYIPNKYDVRGAGELSDLVDNLFIVWMDKKRAAIDFRLDSGYPISDSDQEYHDNKPSHLLVCEKNRHDRWEDKMGLWLNSDSLQLTPSNSCKPMPFDIYNNDPFQEDLI